MVVGVDEAEDSLKEHPAEACSVVEDAGSSSQISLVGYERRNQWKRRTPTRPYSPEEEIFPAADVVEGRKSEVAEEAAVMVEMEEGEEKEEEWEMVEEKVIRTGMRRSVRVQRKAEKKNGEMNGEEPHQQEELKEMEQRAELQERGQKKVAQGSLTSSLASISGEKRPKPLKRVDIDDGAMEERWGGGDCGQAKEKEGAKAGGIAGKRGFSNEEQKKKKKNGAGITPSLRKIDDDDDDDHVYKTKFLARIFGSRNR